jgi:hypothetical protein
MGLTQHADCSTLAQTGTLEVLQSAAAATVLLSSTLYTTSITLHVQLHSHQRYYCLGWLSYVVVSPLLSVAPCAVAELLRTKGVPNVMFWSEDPSGLVAAHFSSIFFGMMALESSVTMLEAYALALFSTQVCGDEQQQQQHPEPAKATLCASAAGEQQGKGGMWGRGECARPSCPQLGLNIPTSMYTHNLFLMIVGAPRAHHSCQSCTAGLPKQCVCTLGMLFCPASKPPEFCYCRRT